MARTSKTTPAKLVKLEADLRIAGAAAAFAALRSAAEERHARITVDVGKVEKVDAAGLQALLAGRGLLVAEGKTVEWTGGSPKLDAAADLLGLREALGLPK